MRYTEAGSGRLVIVGPAGSGKSGAAVLLILAALRYRRGDNSDLSEKDRSKVPVPVMFTLHGWDPDTQDVRAWLAEQLRQTYPLFAGEGGAEDAAALVGAGKVAVILDGLDEIAEKLRPVALQALNRQAVFRVVVLCRSAEMVAAAQDENLVGAVALELQAVDPDIAADFLEGVHLGPAPEARTPATDWWGELINRLRTARHSPLADALNSPLTLTLVRDTYRSGDDVP